MGVHGRLAGKCRAPAPGRSGSPAILSRATSTPPPNDQQTSLRRIPTSISVPHPPTPAAAPQHVMAVRLLQRCTHPHGPVPAAASPRAVLLSQNRNGRSRASGGAGVCRCCCGCPSGSLCVDATGQNAPTHCASPAAASSASPTAGSPTAAARQLPWASARAPSPTAVAGSSCLLLGLHARRAAMRHAGTWASPLPLLFGRAQLHRHAAAVTRNRA